MRGADALSADFDWSLCRVFLAILRHGSMVAAAVELGDSRPTVRRRLERLEAELGSPLFSRSSDGLRPTPLADRLRPIAEELEASASRFRRTAALVRRSGTVRIAAAGLLGSRLLPSVLGRVTSSQPDIRFEHVAAAANPLKRDADVLVTWSRPTQEGVVATVVGTVEFGIFVSGGWSGDGALRPGVGDDVLRRIIVGGSIEHRLLGGGAMPAAPAEGVFAVWSDDEDFCLGAAEAGLGAAVIPTAVGTGRACLRRILPERSFKREVWAAVHPDLRRVPEIRMIIDALRAAFAGGRASAS